jgi:GGDEF domain-containing protein/EAL domain-containing protein (putative c-di-GMP-specific phosphodiesterase class I)
MSSGLFRMPPAAAAWAWAGLGAAPCAWSAVDATVPAPPWPAWLGVFLAGCVLGAALAAWVRRRRLSRFEAWIAAPGPEGPGAWVGAPAALKPASAAASARLHERLAAMSAEQRAARQDQLALLERLWRQVSLDALTGLPSRRSFTARLDLRLGAGVLAGEPAPAACAGALLILRVRGLERLNRRAGREAGDGLLAAVGAALRAYPDRVPGAMAGRLGGADFGLLLPVAGLAAETAAALEAALQPAARAAAGGVEILVAGVDALRAPDASHALAQVDEVLAFVEAGPATPSVRMSGPGPSAASTAVAAADAGAGAGAEAGADAAALWRAASGPQGELSLVRAPVIDSAGRCVARLCSLRLRAGPGRRWLGPRAWRARLASASLAAQAELATVALALEACRDGERHVVTLSVSSLLAEGFTDRVARSLAAARGAAENLALEFGDDGPPGSVPALRAAALLWAAAGSSVGVLLRGGAGACLGPLADAGLAHLAVDIRFLRQGGHDASVQALVWQLRAAARAHGWALHAREVDDAQDLAWVREIGFDTASGPVLGRAGGKVADAS